MPAPIFDGIEVDVISIGDADCIVVTQWHDSLPHRILIDGGRDGDAQAIKDFLLKRGYTYFWAALCTHLHNDHASGLTKIVRDTSFTFSNGYMHDIHRHVSSETLRCACSSVDGVKEVAETTKELAAAFASRGITPLELFSGMEIAIWPAMTVLGPSVSLYRKAIGEFTKVESPTPRPLAASPHWAAALALGSGTPAPLTGLGSIGMGQPPRYAGLASLAPLPAPPPLSGALTKSSVQESPTTQPYNNTSVILGATFKGDKLLFTADAGSDALALVSANWNRLSYMGIPHHGSDGNLSQKDIERFCPQFATISAKGDSSHPSRAIVSGLVKVGTKVASTHKSGNLWFHSGSVPPRADYGPAEFLEGTGQPQPVIDWTQALSRFK